MKTKICTGICKLEKSLSEFYFRKDSSSYRNECIVCILKQNKQYRDLHTEYYKENKDKMLKKAKKYRDNNKIKIAKYMKKWREENKEHIKEYDKTIQKQRNKKDRNRRKVDIQFKLTHNLRKRIWDALKNNTKSKRTLELLGCTIDELKIHLENQFKYGMNWNNYGIGGWEIDHKLPCAKFDLSKEKEQLECFNSTNLQPLWADENRRKGSK